MHRLPLLDMLRRYSTRYPDEAAVIAQVRQLIENAADCFERTCRPGHVTGSAWILTQDHTRCLLLHHRKLDCWLQPGGHADGQAEIEQVALREAQEESGLTQLELDGNPEDLVPLDIDVHVIPARLDAAGNIAEDRHEHHDIRFLVVASADQELVLSEESNDLRWFSCQEVFEVTDEESVLRMMRKAGPHATG
jgi:8-oxo-dGTP pyrophosphatase MutT (NUDIX family)